MTLTVYMTKTKIIIFMLFNIYIAKLIGEDILIKYRTIKYTIRMKRMDKKKREYDKKNNNSI